MLSSPIGFGQHGAEGFDRRITSRSTGDAASRLTSAAKLPNVFGCVFWIVNTTPWVRVAKRGGRTHAFNPGVVLLAMQ